MTILLFDGVCNFCNGIVQFIIERDPRARIRFAPLQSDIAATLLASHPDRANLPDTVVLVEDGQVYVRSTAALRVARHLRFPWSLAWMFMVVPRPVRDWVYDWIARHRYAWFGKRDTCMVPTPDITNRFLK
ncbi:MAG TPA: thiol-disulfide oxidoreductase DCC family protein [Vicinamibacterales bacterium]|nr:thiol-disulfide oxidoreductase DCC family protein [Vicinamibacterales bacterium]